VILWFNGIDAASTKKIVGYAPSGQSVSLRQPYMPLWHIEKEK
jgi:hypothetical protein